MQSPMAFSTYLLNHEPASRAISRFADAGVNRLELFGGEYTHWHPNDSVEHMRDILASKMVEVPSIHLPKEELVHAAGFEIEGAIGRLVEGVRFGASLGAKTAVLHAGVFQSGDLEESKKALVEAVTTVCDAAAKLGVEILVENLPRFDEEVPFGTAVSDLVWLCETSNRPNIGICFDTGHAHVNGLALSDELQVGAKWTRSLHISDNHGLSASAPRSSDEHLPPGEGSIDWVGFAGCLKSLSIRGVEVIYEPASKAWVPEEETIRRCLLSSQLFWSAV